MEIKISIIIPVYMVAGQLNRMLESIINQTYENFEIILVEDGSPDACPNICEQWKKNDERIHVIHQKNAGVSVARNRGFLHSKGEYIIFLDADDKIDSHMLKDMKNALDNSKADMVCCGFFNIFSDKTECLTPQNGELVEKEILYALLTQSGFFRSVWNKMFCRKILLDENEAFIEFEEGIAIGEDGLWLSKVLANCRKVVCLEKPYYSWYRRQNSATCGDDKVRIDGRSLTVLNAYKKTAEEMKKIDENLYQISFKQYLSMIKIKLLEAYRLKNDILKEELLLEALKEIGCYHIKSSRDVLFVMKYRILLFLIKSNSNYDVVDRIERLGR